MKSPFPIKESKSSILNLSQIHTELENTISHIHKNDEENKSTTNSKKRRSATGTSS